MSIKTTSNLLIVPSLNSHAGFYQQLLSTISSFQELAHRAVKIAEHGRVFRQYDVVNEAAHVLINLPSKEHQAIGHYYLGWRAFMTGSDAKAYLERAAEYAPAKYRALAMYSLGAIEARRQDHGAEMAWLLESAKIYPCIDVIRGMAVVKAKEGYHPSALKDLESLLPLLRNAEPFVYYDCLNSLAVELGEVGRLQEAQNVSSLVCRSPFAPYYKEWQDTFIEVNQKAYNSRSSVHVVLPKKEPEKQTNKAKILPFPQRKPEPFFRPSFGPPTREETAEAANRATGLDPKQLLAMIIKLVMKDGVTEEQIFQIVDTYYDVMVNGLE